MTLPEYAKYCRQIARRDYGLPESVTSEWVDKAFESAYEGKLTPGDAVMFLMEDIQASIPDGRPEEPPFLSRMTTGR